MRNTTGIALAALLPLTMLAATHKAGETRTVVLPGGATMALVWCPPGSFMMGCAESWEGNSQRAPRHRVTLTKGFWMGKYEVTQRQWQSVMGSNPSGYKGMDRPVELVSWTKCQEFCARCRKAGLGLRLPTEAEWEYACRAGTQSAYTGTGCVDDMGWCDESSEYEIYGFSMSETHAVGRKEANDWGLYDMLGNVWEWCADRYDGAYPRRAEIDPTGSNSGSRRVLRGGSQCVNLYFCCASNRNRMDPDNGDGDTGFRVACSAGKLD